MLTKEEKILLLQLILKDIRWDWSYNVENRAEKALNLSKELGFTHMVKSIEMYLQEIEEGGDGDGRYFRTSFESGGYEGMEEVHGLPLILGGKSSEFYIYLIRNLNHPGGAL